MGWIRPFRLASVADGACLIVICLLISFGASWWVFSTAPELAPNNGRVATIVPGAVISVLAISISAYKWTRRLSASTSEALGVLVVMQLIVAGVLEVLGLRQEIGFVLPVSNLFFGPWWFLGHMAGVI